MKKSITKIRKEYTLQSLPDTKLKRNPFKQFEVFWKEVIHVQIDEPNAMVLSTSYKNKPSSRVVLLKSFDKKGFIFFTNYNSQKGIEIYHNPKGSLLFFWKELQRQVRIEGKIKKISAKDSEKYFHTRPLKSQIATWASSQSQQINNRKVLEDNFVHFESKFETLKHIPRPKHWGGYILVPNYFEFWQGRESRLHDRIAYIKQKNNLWKRCRIAP